MAEEREILIEPEPPAEESQNTEETTYSSEDLLFLYSAAYDIESTVLAGLGAAIANQEEMDSQKVCAENMWLKYESEKDLRVLPAIAISGKFTSDVPTVSNSEISHEHLLRQGILVRAEDDPTLFFYIGGISPYWAAGNVYIFQGGAEFETQVYADPLKKYKSIGIGVLPIYRSDYGGIWLNPPKPYKIKGAQLAFLSTYQWFNSSFDLLSYINFKITEHRERVPEDLSSTRHGLLYESDEIAFLVPLIAVPSSVSSLSSYLSLGVYAFGLTSNSVGGIIDVMCKQLGNKGISLSGRLKTICKYSASLINNAFSDINNGAPIFASLYVGPAGATNKSLCTNVALVGFAKSVNPVTDQFGNKDVIFPIVYPPSGYTTSQIMEWARSLGFDKELDFLIKKVKKVREIILLLFPNYPTILQLAYDLSLELGWDDQLEEKLAPYAEKVKKVISMVREELVKEKLYRCLNDELIANCFKGVNLESDVETIYKGVLGCTVGTCVENEER